MLPTAGKKFLGKKKEEGDLKGIAAAEIDSKRSNKGLIYLIKFNVNLFFLDKINVFSKYQTIITTLSDFIN